MPQVSVLFSEPKIPQFKKLFAVRPDYLDSFSALQRAENSSIGVHIGNASATTSVSVLFSEPKIPQLEYPHNPKRNYSRFQCSSASRKFLNLGAQHAKTRTPTFQCSSASRKFLNQSPHCDRDSVVCVSVLFSEPKIPQYSYARAILRRATVSVLFSEPKIPQ